MSKERFVINPRPGSSSQGCGSIHAFHAACATVGRETTYRFPHYSVVTQIEQRTRGKSQTIHYSRTGQQQGDKGLSSWQYKELRESMKGCEASIVYILVSV